MFAHSVLPFCTDIVNQLVYPNNKCSYTTASDLQVTYQRRLELKEEEEGVEGIITHGPIDNITIHQRYVSELILQGHCTGLSRFGIVCEPK